MVHVFPGHIHSAWPAGGQTNTAGTSEVLSAHVVSTVTKCKYIYVCRVGEAN